MLFRSQTDLTFPAWRPPAAIGYIAIAIGEALGYPLTTRSGQTLDDARERLGAERAARAARRGAALSEAESLTRAAAMVQAACVT